MFDDKDNIIVLQSKKMNQYDIDNVVQILREGKIIIFPTETVYGIACNANKMNSVRKIYNIKRRDYNKPLLIHIGDKNNVYKYIKYVYKKTEQIIKKLWPGPITIITEKSDEVPLYVTCGSEKVGVRCVDNKITQGILNKCNFPVVATSANYSGEKECLTIDECVRKFGNLVDIYIDDGEIKSTKPSTIVKIEKNNIDIIRKGAMNEKQIHKCFT